MTRSRTARFFVFIAVLAAVLAAVSTAAAQPASGVKAKLTPDARFVLTGVDFTGVTATLAPAARLPLLELAQVLKAHPETRLRIEAFVDPTDANAQDLSDQRATAVVARLVALGAPAATLEARGMGGTEFLVPSIVAAMKAKNRRIQVRVLTPPRAAPLTVTTPVAVATPPPVPSATPAVSGATRVIVVSSRNTAAGASALVSSALRRAGADVVRVAEVREARPVTVVYHLPQWRAEAERLRSAGALAGASLVSVQRIDPQTSLMVVLGDGERR